MSRIRKVFTISVMLVTVLAMTVVVVPEVNAAASAGDLIKMDGLSSVYYLGADSKRYVFPNEQTYFSWYSDFSGVVTIPQSELETYPLGANVTIRPGTKLVKITTDPKVYAVEPNGTLKWVPSEATAAALYGANWATKVIDVSDAFFTNYTVSTVQVSATAYPTGSLVKFGTSADVYYINADGTASKVATEAAFLANRFKWADVITSTLTLPTAGTEIASATMIDTSQGGGAGTGLGAGAGTGLTVALASDTPAAGTTLSESTDGGDGAQAFIPVTKINFTAASDGAVKVTNLKFKRGGIPSADTDFADFYLYDGSTLLATYSSVAEGVLTFNSAAGLFTVAAGTTKGITLKVNLVDEAAASRAYNYSVLTATDITTDGATVSGTFPITGNTMAVATVTDLGKITMTDTGTVSDPDPGTTDHTIWSFTLASDAQNIDVEKIKLTIIGTVDTTDMTNFKLEVAGAQIGETVVAMASDKTVTFDFATPYRIDKGLTKTVNFTADIVGGTSRTFQVYLYNKEDLMAKDVEYGVYLTINQADVYAKVKDAETTNTISTGTLTVSKNLDGPSGNVALGATNVEIGRFDFIAVGEAIKVTSLWPYVNVLDTGSNAGLYQLKFYVDGVQIGTAIDLAENNDTEVAVGNSFIIPAGETKTLMVKSDIKVATGTAMTNNDTITFQLGQTGGTGAGAGADYTRQLTGTTGSTGLYAANVLTVRTGALTAAENNSFGDRSVTNPTGVVNAVGVKLASFTLTAGAGEAVTITQITLADYNAATLMGDNFQNLILKNGDTQLGATRGNLNASSVGTYAFSPSPAISLAAGAQYVVDVYGDVKSGAEQTAMDMFGVKFYSATATGQTTSASANCTTAAFEMQTMYIAAAGTLYISDDANTPIAQQIVMGATDQEIARFKLEASASEDLSITQLTVADQVSRAASGTLKNIKIYDGTTLVGGPVQLDTTSATTTYVRAVFSGINLTIPANGSKTLIVKADVGTAVDGAVSGSTHKFAVLINDNITGETMVVKGAQSGTVLTDASGINFYSTTDAVADVDQTVKIMTVYRTKVTAAWASDTPSGTSIGDAAQVIAKLNITNSANAGSHTATIKNINLALTTSISNDSDRNLNIYKDSVTTTTLKQTGWLAAGVQNFGNTAITDMTDVEISSGETKLFIVTLDTQDANDPTSGTKLLGVNFAAGDIEWDDSAGTTLSTCNSLPLGSKSFSYPN